jgi:hypothetical protein
MLKQRGNDTVPNTHIPMSTVFLGDSLQQPASITSTTRGAELRRRVQEKQAHSSKKRHSYNHIIR